MEYFRIKNFDKYQTEKKFKKGNLRLLMLDVDMMEDPKIYNMTAVQFACWVRLLLISRKFDNQIPQDPRWLSARLGFPASHRRVDLAFLWDLGLLEAVAEPWIGEDRKGMDRIGEDSKGEGRSRGPAGPAAPQKSLQETERAKINAMLGIANIGRTI